MQENYVIKRNDKSNDVYVEFNVKELNLINTFFSLLSTDELYDLKYEIECIDSDNPNEIFRYNYSFVDIRFPKISINVTFPDEHLDCELDCIYFYEILTSYINEYEKLFVETKNVSK